MDSEAQEFLESNCSLSRALWLTGTRSNGAQRIIRKKQQTPRGVGRHHPRQDGPRQERGDVLAYSTLLKLHPMLNDLEQGVYQEIEAGVKVVAWVSHTGNKESTCGYWVNSVPATCGVKSENRENG